MGTRRPVRMGRALLDIRIDRNDLLDLDLGTLAEKLCPTDLMRYITYKHARTVHLFIYSFAPI